MIAHLEGKVIHIDQKFIVLDVAGVGYKVSLTSDNISRFSQGDETSFWIYTAVRENSIDLYGFASFSEMSFFEMLLDVSGIGPKSALSILGVATIDILKKAIATGDTSYLNKVSGIGKKTAEKIVIELRDKLYAHKDEAGNSASLQGESDVVEALKSLGYSQTEARDVLREIPSSVEGSSAKVREALKILGNK